MVDDAYADGTLAGLYDALNPWAPSDDFYLGLVLAAGDVLDAGCGTGALLRRAREAGHTGRLTGLDPAAAMLGVARRRSDVEWVLGDVATARWERAFDLVVMTGHAFQVLLTDGDVRDSLAAVARALRAGGTFAFETRNPAVRPWEAWTPERGTTVTAPDGTPVRAWHRVESVDGELVTFTTTFAGTTWQRTSRSTLRFLDAAALDGFLAGAGLEVEARYGDWDRQPYDAASSPEIVTIARR